MEVNIWIPRLPGLEKGLISTNQLWIYIVNEFVDWSDARENDTSFFDFEHVGSIDDMDVQIIDHCDSNDKKKSIVLDWSTPNNVCI